MTTRMPPTSSNEHSIDPEASPSEAHIVNPPAAVIFDFDGTIADTETPVYEAARIAHEEHGHDVNARYLPEQQAADGRGTTPARQSASTK